MHFGVVSDPNPHEHRVVMTPYGVEELVARGHQVTVESGAGERAQFSDKDYEIYGAQIAFSKEEAWMRPDMLLRFHPPERNELGMLRDGQVFGSYVELPFLPVETREAYKQHNVTLMAFEEMRDQRDRWPLLFPLSIICGRMLPQIAAHYLESFEGGRGKLLGGAPGVAPCNISIVGAGVLGSMATNMFQALGARVTVLDVDPIKLEQLELHSRDFLTTLNASPGNIRRICRGSDVLIFAIHCPEGVCPKVLKRSHLKEMQPKSLIIDASITQGGACETSRPTDVFNPSYEVDGIVHYCNTRITALVSRTASRAVASVLVSYLNRFAEDGLDAAIEKHREFDTSLICVKGEMRSKYNQ